MIGIPRPSSWLPKIWSLTTWTKPGLSHMQEMQLISSMKWERRKNSLMLLILILMVLPFHSWSRQSAPSRMEDFFAWLSQTWLYCVQEDHMSASTSMGVFHFLTGIAMNLLWEWSFTWYHRWLTDMARSLNLWCLLLLTFTFDFSLGLKRARSDAINLYWNTAQYTNALTVSLSGFKIKVEKLKKLSRLMSKQGKLKSISNKGKKSRLRRMFKKNKMRKPKNPHRKLSNVFVYPA